eukprot:3941977-Rhodomonas_salina.1
MRRVLPQSGTDSLCWYSSAVLRQPHAITCIRASVRAPVYGCLRKVLPHAPYLLHAHPDGAAFVFARPPPRARPTTTTGTAGGGGRTHQQSGGYNNSAGSNSKANSSYREV